VAIRQRNLIFPVKVILVKGIPVRVLTYTLNDPARAQALLSMGLDGVITDAVDSLGSTK
jgi:glycerophosphoryl diester phosphodiesterase